LCTSRRTYGRGLLGAARRKEHLPAWLEALQPCSCSSCAAGCSECLHASVLWLWPVAGMLEFCSGFHCRNSGIPPRFPAQRSRQPLHACISDPHTDPCMSRHAILIQSDLLTETVEFSHCMHAALQAGMLEFCSGFHCRNSGIPPRFPAQRSRQRAAQCASRPTAAARWSSHALPPLPDSPGCCCTCSRTCRALAMSCVVAVALQLAPSTAVPYCYC
jgi:hypothetical protein